MRFILSFPLMLAAVPLSAQHFRSHEMIVSDPVTGAAILGFDAVAYLLERAPVAGSDEHQADFGGKVWYFASNANRAAFIEKPELYLPGFGGYDPVSAASGIPVAGSTRIHAIRDGRLFLFRTTENRRRFLETPAILAEAERVWPEVRRGLSP
jgi:YHS domain-containing protein